MKQTVAIVGGGIAGLSCAAHLARAGCSPVVYERSRNLGGRAATQHKHDFQLNLGPHALYAAGVGSACLAELSVELSAHVPRLASYALAGGELRTLPTGLWSMLVTSALSLPAKLEAAKLLQSLPKLDPAEFAGVSAAAWLDTHRHADTRALMAAILRLTTYGGDLERLDAGAALAQVQLAMRGNVLYVDGGWQVLVDGLRDAATTAGARIETAAPVIAIERRGARFAVVSKAETTIADRVVIAASPGVAAKLAPWSAPLADWAARAQPTTVACLDVALAQLPRPRRTFVLGIDEPHYLSVHSSAARLAPDGGALIHVAAYSDGGAALKPALYDLLDRAQPGWRDVLVHERFLPSLTVTHDTPAAARGGLAGRFGPTVPGCAGLYVAGDWVGGEGMLADASFASARAVAVAIAAQAAAAAPAHVDRITGSSASNSAR